MGMMCFVQDGPVLAINGVITPLNGRKNMGHWASNPTDRGYKLVTDLQLVGIHFVEEGWLLKNYTPRVSCVFKTRPFNILPFEIN